MRIIPYEIFVSGNRILALTNPNVITSLRNAGVFIIDNASVSDITKALVDLYFKDKNKYLNLVSLNKIDYSKLSPEQQNEAKQIMSQINGQADPNAKCGWWENIMGCSDSTTVKNPTNNTQSIVKEPILGASAILGVGIFSIIAILFTVFIITRSN